MIGRFLNDILSNIRSRRALIIYYVTAKVGGGRCVN